MKILIYLTIFISLYFVYGIYLSQSNLLVIPSTVEPENPAGYYDYKGIINVHSDRSTGSEPPQQIISAASSVGADFVVFTDNNQFESARPISNYYDNTLVMFENEYSFLDSRILTLTTNSDLNFTSGSESSVKLTDLLSQNSTDNPNSLLILSHPFNRDLTWTGPFPTGFDGLEVINPKAISQRSWQKSKLNIIWTLFAYPFNSRVSFLRMIVEPRDELALLDTISQQRRVLAFAGADATARAIPFSNFLVKFPSYQKSLAIASNHVLLTSELTGNFQKDRQKLVTAMKAGNFFISLDLLGDPKGFVSYLENQKGEKYLMGTSLKFQKKLSLKAKLAVVPKAFFEIVVFKNGENVFLTNKPELEYQITEPGVYRVTVRVSPALPFPDGKKWITWIYTNPFWVSP
jgi:hypothetical protein